MSERSERNATTREDFFATISSRIVAKKKLEGAAIPHDKSPRELRFARS